MFTKSRVGLIVPVVLIAWGMCSTDVWPQEKKAPSSNEERAAIMKKKLGQAQKLLEGLALQDFDKLKAAVNELASLRLQGAWMEEKTLEYERFSIDFQRNLESLQRAATEKNIDGVALAYIEMTMTCVKCHKHVKEPNKK